MKRLDLIVGPNGAGKSTFIAFTLAPLLSRSVLVNADEIAKRTVGPMIQLYAPTMRRGSLQTPAPS